MLYIVPIESYDLRYTEQWNRWFPKYLIDNNISHEIIWGKAEKISLLDQKSDVLDVYGTHIYKSYQLIEIYKRLERGEIKNGDVLFFHTLWFPGIDSLQYIRQCTGIDFRITGVLHAGSYDPWDFRSRYGMTFWATHLERGWLSFVDRIFVASKFHKSMVIEALGIDSSRIFVTRLPINVSEIVQGRKEITKMNRVAYPHRLISEKCPEIVEFIQKNLTNVEIIVTRNVCRTKSEFYDLLATCKISISNSFQETFGYSMIEAAALGSLPLVPKRLCYQEMYPDDWCFKNESELIEKIRFYLNKWEDPRPRISNLIAECEGSIETMIRLSLESTSYPAVKE